ncbi:methyltransferase domain-containing protein [Undibacterium sp. LX40W]|uniref:Methyltransferase domain-containing protein n=1 Tax=Undibacterium nitidum TaxID=2762298 RepID=A0A923KVM8_9BURK|nr:class I SAM-dependent methyltransferase [Undibacterium nitidum]MBC3883307.1 methyltransferase domain-containing protein [Undibacterium nitidum]MBC3893546.1 methyltransferase domain-containing protein [Undibacterium sp. LX40W]
MSEVNSTNPAEAPIIDLGSWLEQPAGSYIRAWEEAQFNRMTADIFGFHALQIGLPQIHALAASRMPHQWQTDSTMPAPNLLARNQVVVVHDFAELPFDSQSIDLVILPHVLEFATEPHQILREVDRILIPEGRVIISGLNRASLWGARQLFGRAAGRSFLPKEGEFISANRLKDWLKLLSMEVSQTQFGCYAMPVNNEQWLSSSDLVEKIGQRWWPYFGAVYMFEAIKRVRGMHLVGPALQRKKMRQVSAVPVANKIKKHGQN